MDAHPPSRPPEAPTPGKPAPGAGRPLTTGEKLGHIWAVVFLAMVAVLTVLLAGKGCFGGG